MINLTRSTFNFLENNRMTEKDMCMVCIEPFTKQAHKKQANCPYCDIQACVNCTQTYLVGTHEDAHCMGCRRVWTREVLDQLLLTTWINGAYKKHRENILLDRERSRLPAAQIILERRKQAEERKPILDTISQKIDALQRQINILSSEFEQESYRIELLKNGHDPFERRTDNKQATEEKRVFIMPCPATDCRGFLSQAYKCGVCDIYVCPDCREIKGLQRDATHTCNPDTVASVQRMKKECRACPECGVSIFRQEGCSQMFCTACNTPFDWTTGRKITSGALHNPHYFEYLKKMNNNIQPRNPGDIPCITNLPSAWRFREKFHHIDIYSNHVVNMLYTALNVITHIQHVEIPATTNNVQDTDNTQYNVQYIDKQISEERWKQILQQREKKRIKKDEIRMRYEAFLGACVDIFGRLMATLQTNNQMTIPQKEKDKLNYKEVDLTYDTLKELISIFNEGMKDISRRYKCKVVVLNPATMKLDRMKYTVPRTKKDTTKSTTKKGVKAEEETDIDSISDSDSEDETPRKNTIVKRK